MTGYRKLSLGASLGNPANIKNRASFSTAKWSDVNAMYRMLGGGMPSLQGSQDTVWPDLCRAMHGWSKGNEAHRALIIVTDRPLWVSHETFYGHWMIALCLRLRWAREKWIRTLFHSLCLQFQVDTADELAGKLRTCMDRDDSIIHVGFSISSRRSCYGLVEARTPH